MTQGGPIGWSSRRIVLSGHAKLPQEAAARAVYEILSIVVAVEPRHGVIVQVDATLVTAPAKAFLRDLLLGACLADPAEPVLEHVQRHYWGGAKRALLAAIRELYDRWSELQTLNETSRAEGS